MKRLNDKEVRKYIVEFRNGNEEAYEILLKNYYRQIMYVINKYNFDALPYQKEDIEIELKLELFKAINSFDLEGETEFYVYLYGKYIHRISRLFRKYNTKKRFTGIQHTMEGQLAEGMSYNDVIAEDSDFENEYITKKYVETKLSEIEAILSKEEYEIYLMYFEGIKAREIATHFNIEYDKMKSKIGYIRRKIRKYINK